MVEQKDTCTWYNADGFIIKYYGDTGIYECLAPDNEYLKGFNTLRDAMIYIETVSMYHHNSPTTE